MYLGSWLIYDTYVKEMDNMGQLLYLKFNPTSQSIETTKTYNKVLQ